MPELSDDELLAELGVGVVPARKGKHTPLEERIIAGFEDLERFFETNGRAPRHGEGLDIFERLYAVRLDRLRANPEALRLLSGMDRFGLLRAAADAAPVTVDLTDEDLLAELGVDAAEESNIAVLRHVTSREDRRAAEEIANRTVCADFDTFKPMFEQVESELRSRDRSTERFGGEEKTKISVGDFFIVGGQIAYVAEKGELHKAPNGSWDARLRVIYSNGTESNLLGWSLQRALYKDEAGRRILDIPPLFTDEWSEEDVSSGTIYVLRSLSEHPFIAEHRELIHKIGVAKGSVELRTSDAKNLPTYLLADVQVVATYKLADVNRYKLEHLFHKIFASAQLDLTIEDRFGRPVKPREWFVVPLSVIDEAVRRILDGSITKVLYDPATATLSEV